MIPRFTLLLTVMATLGVTGRARDPQTHDPQPPLALTMGPATFLTTCPTPRIPLVADTNGDGRADFLAINPVNHSVTCARMAAAGKLLRNVPALKNFGDAEIAAASGRFSGRVGADVLGVFADGTIRVANGLSTDGAADGASPTIVTKLPISLLPREPVLAVSADFDGDGKQDVLLEGADGKLLLLRNSHGEGERPLFEALPVVGGVLTGRRLGAGALGGAGKASVVWLDATGIVKSAGLTRLAGKTMRLEAPVTLTRASPDDGLAVGRFRGENRADVVVGQRLLPGGDASLAIPLPNLPDAEKAKGDLLWIAADLNGDGKDDIVRVQRNSDRFDGQRVYVYYSHDSNDRPALQFDESDNDGLLDAWKTGAIRPGGLDLKALGCKVGHADVIVEVQRMEAVPDAQLHLDMDKAVKYFAALPVKNADGKPGIALHVIYGNPIPQTDRKVPWRELAERCHLAAHHGITHWMVVYDGGGGQSSRMNDAGSCGNKGMPNVFIHEFGHQLGLDHTGGWGPTWCPTYSSLMNYAYNYQLNGKKDNAGFSDGRLASLVLNERHLDEYLPLAPDKVAFLAGPPYRYRMKPAPDGKGTLIDWNWNGVFGEKNVVADINYGYSTTAGERFVVGKSYSAPALASSSSGKLILFNTLLAPGAPLPIVEEKAKDASVSAVLPGRLCMRVWRGNDPGKDGAKWSAENTIEPSEVTAEASAATLQNATWVAYPTDSGVKIRRVALDANDLPQIGAAVTVPDSKGAQPTLTAFAGRLALLLWRDPKTAIGLRWLDVANLQVNCAPAETPLAFTSNDPPGAAAGTDSNSRPALWVGITQDKDPTLLSRWQIRCLTLDSAKGSILQTAQTWADGDRRGGKGQGRITVLWEADKDFGPEGRWYLFQRGAPGKDLGQSLVSMRILDNSVNGGCLARRYYDEWTNSRSAPAACWFRGDIALAMRRYGDQPTHKNDSVFVAFFGRGIESDSMGDFDDLHEIRDFGLAGSLATAGEDGARLSEATSPP